MDNDVKEEAQYELDVSDAQETEVELGEEPKIVETEAQETVAEVVTEDDSEHEEYSASVKKRINRLTKKMREAERQREEALRYAQQVQTESEQLRTRVNSLDHGYMTEYGNRLNVEHRQAENDYKRAVELGDPDATLEAQRKLTELSIQANQYTQAQQAAQQRQQYEQQYAQQATQQPAQPAQPQAPDPKAEEWAKKNEWFGQDEAMTFAAFGVHKKLVEDEGFDPQSDDYYNELDNRMRDEFPHKLNNTGSERRPAQTVAGVSRSTTGRTNSKRVKLSPTQVAIAKKLGVPLEEYAKYVRD
tara:strand:- start:1129 stop:2034 length:906 start_codon:yes stop_codon:yes gene_type:complete